MTAGGVTIYDQISINVSGFSGACEHAIMSCESCVWLHGHLKTALAHVAIDPAHMQSPHDLGETLFTLVSSLETRERSVPALRERGFRVDAQRWSRSEQAAPLLDPADPTGECAQRQREDDISSLTS
jgi:hypothetical protein